MVRNFVRIVNATMYAAMQAQKQEHQNSSCEEAVRWSAQLNRLANANTYDQFKLSLR
jgi:hypothetical protein